MSHEIADSLRAAARRFPTGVTVMAAALPAGCHAMTANSFVTLSLRPALIGIAITRDGRMRDAVQEAGAFGVSILGDDQEDCARYFANPDRSGRDDLVLTGHAPRVPEVPGCLAHFSCRLWSIFPVGDHELVVGQVLRCRTLDACTPPLVFVGGSLVSARLDLVEGR